jgi:signal transduction histidine kinase
VLVVGAAVAEWLRQPSGEWVVAVWVAAAAAIAALRPWSGWRRRGLVVAIGALAVGLTNAHLRLHAVETAWDKERAHAVRSATTALARSLHLAYRGVTELAAEGTEAAAGDREAAFRHLARAVPVFEPEMGVVVLDSSGAPWAWAGQHRLPPSADGDSITVRTTGYYVVLEARRHSANGRVAVASALLWAHASVPERNRSLAEMLRRETDVSVVLYPAAGAPKDPDLFRYEEPGAGGSPLLAALPVPPEQGAAKELTFERGSRVVTWLLLLVLGLAFSLAPRPLERYVVLAFGVWLAARAPIGAALGAQALFSPATFFRPILGPLSGSAGALGLAGGLLTLGGVWLWLRRPPRRWYGLAAAAVLLLASPSLVIALARGITPPARGAPPGLWLSWELTLLFAASAPLVVAAALFRGTAQAVDRWRIPTGVAIAMVASIVGLFGWSPDGWPDWYPFLWAPALLLVALPAPRSATILGIGLVAGSSAALATWGAELAGRLQVAQRDVARLGPEPDPLALPLLEGFGEAVRRGPPPTTASEMYALWGESQLGEQAYPAHLALWSRDGALRDELPLDSLDVPLPLLAAMVRGLPAAQTQRVTPLRRLPGVHYVLAVRVGPGSVMTVAVGPRSRLVPPGRLGRLLDPDRRASTLYTLTLAPPSSARVDEGDFLHWRREGWTLRAERLLELPGGPREVRAAIDLRGPLPVTVRGILVVLFDVGVLALAWLLAEFVAGARPVLPRWRSLARSFRFRLAVTLAVFFMLPTVGFSIWGFVRLAAEAERGRDLLITQTLRDAALGAPGLERSRGAGLEDQLRELSRRVDADLALYRGGALAATSAPVLQDLGVVGQLMDPAAFRALTTLGQLELTRQGPMPELGERVGFRVVQPGGPASLGVLATPQVADDSNLGARQLDLALVLLLATIVGVVAALIGARRAALALSRPVSELRRSAIALGRGQAMPPHSAHPPLEFEPVFGAFERMAADIRSSQSALEEARRRTATVLATVATGVVGLDQDGRVIIANRQAVDLLGVPLAEGDPLVERLGPGWGPLADAVREFLAAPGLPGGGTELTVDGRRVTVQLAALGPDLRGAVLALNDVSDISRAERVLAWGEMARQVAHEIKNPLTPMRLGVQHLRRVWRDRRNEFDGTLEDTARRILGEIDRLDTIARAFSRFAAPGPAQEPLEPVDLAEVADEVVQLYQLAGEGAAAVRLETTGPAFGHARRDEIKEVLVNLLENARNAGAATIVVAVAPGRLEVRDDGSGIPPDLLPRVFEPRFSTTTSGSGLGLAIVRRLVESWGGRVELESAVGRGTTVVVRLAPVSLPARSAGL